MSIFDNKGPVGLFNQLDEVDVFLPIFLEAFPHLLVYFIHVYSDVYDNGKSFPTFCSFKSECHAIVVMK